ncbi:alcohol dehydrogenase catalytic domain-containing protein [Streptomyces sp. NPDC051243]|uniref:alcohol dehydrogenase catalytic domain-containing protein n=1 Tax=Streptomyces sp. NPDC051243 TaxID=3365646 RepID=UPI0037A6FD7F
MGLCGTDREIAEGQHGSAPQGRDRFVIGHESLGQVLRSPAGTTGFHRGDLVAGVVRRPDPCRAARAPTAGSACAATAATPSGASRNSTASPPRGGLHVKTVIDLEA